MKTVPGMSVIRGERMRICLWTYLFLFTAVPPAIAGEADVIQVVAQKSADGSYHFNVTVAHADEGWEHYADKWDVVAPDGTVLGTRTLYHPHVNEQPFTRSLSGVTVPAETTAVNVRAHDSVHEYGGKVVPVELQQ